MDLPGSDRGFGHSHPTSAPTTPNHTTTITAAQHALALGRSHMLAETSGCSRCSHSGNITRFAHDAATMAPRAVRLSSARSNRAPAPQHKNLTPAGTHDLPCHQVEFAVRHTEQRIYAPPICGELPSP